MEMFCVPGVEERNVATRLALIYTTSQMEEGEATGGGMACCGPGAGWEHQDH